MLRRRGSGITFWDTYVVLGIYTSTQMGYYVGLSGAYLGQYVDTSVPVQHVVA